MEALHWRYHPLAEAMIGVVAELGALEHGEAVFAVNVSDKSRFLYDYSLGGGASIDLGCYPVHWLRTLTGEEPEVVQATAVDDGDRVDLALTADLSSFRVPCNLPVLDAGALWDGRHMA